MGESALEKVTITEYAKRHGVDRKTIRDRIKSGAIPESAIDRSRKWPKVIVELADAAWEKNKDPERAHRLGKPKPVATPDPKENELEEWETLPDDEPTPQKPEPDPDTVEANKSFLKYKSAKASREELAVRKLQMEIAEKEGRLLDAEEVRKTVSKLVIETKTALLNIPGKIGPELMSCHDLMELEHKLTTEINAALENLQRVKIGGDS